MLDNWEFYSSFDKLDFEVNSYQRIEILRQLISHFDFGNISLEQHILNPINYDLLSNSFTQENKEALNSVSTDIMIRLYMKCCAYGMFDTHEDSGNKYFPYFPEHITPGTIAFIKSDPYN